VEWEEEGRRGGDVEYYAAGGDGGSVWFLRSGDGSSPKSMCAVLLLLQHLKNSIEL
jgi:hypothetical protein